MLKINPELPVTVQVLQNFTALKFSDWNMKSDDLEYIPNERSLHQKSDIFTLKEIMILSTLPFENI